MNSEDKTGRTASEPVEAASELTGNSIVERFKHGIISSWIIGAVFLFVFGAVFGEVLGAVVNPLLKVGLSGLFDKAGVEYFLFYFNFFYYWVGMCLALVVVKPGRKYLKDFGTAPKGNTVPMLLLGLVVGLAMNAFCIGAAVLMGNIQGFELSAFQPLQIVLFVLVILIQSSFEEILDRGFIFQRVNHAYGPVVAMVANALFFSLVHSFNDGVNPLALVSIFAIGMLLSLARYYFDSLWIAFGIHTGWNFCQGVLFGLPNSGNATGYAVFRPVGQLTNSFAYDVSFGVESTVVAIVLFVVLSVLVYLWGRKHARSCYDVFNA